MREYNFGRCSGAWRVGEVATTAINKDSEKGKNEWVMKREEEWVMVKVLKMSCSSRDEEEGPMS